MIIVPTSIPLFLSNRSDVLFSVRYLASNTTTTNTTTNTTTSNTTTKTNSTIVVNTNTTKGWTKVFDNSTAFISINPNLSNISSEVCTTYYLNYLSIYCNGTTVQSPNMNRSDIYEYETTRIPQPYQLKKGLDHMNRRAMIYGYMNITVFCIKFLF